MFDQEFYPTPENVLDQMGIDCVGKIVLEPSAGKGDIVDYVKKWGAMEVLSVEKVPELRQILSNKSNVIGIDFFEVKSEEVSHIDLVVMNPPFSNADKHILHAWKIAPEGCEIIALCNNDTIKKNDYGNSRRELYELIKNYGESINLGNVFSNAERTTNVEIGLVRLFKPMFNDSEKFEDFYLEADDDVEKNAVISYNEIRSVVNTYISAVKTFDKVEALAKELSMLTNVEFIGKQLEDGTYEKHKLSYGDGLVFKASYTDQLVTKEAFAKGYQLQCWQFIFDRVNIAKYVTKGVMEDINRFIQNRKNYPFTVKNINKMLGIIMGTRNDIMNRAIVEAVDNFTKYSHENRYGVEGWKTNSSYLLNHKFIVDYIVETGFSGKLQFKYYGSSYSVDYLMDLFRALCFLTATDFDTIKKPYDMNNLKPNTWYDWGFFEFKVFKKGTAHFKFKSKDDWAILNRAYAKIKGEVLPEKI